jgi:hypothetical protein
MKEKQISDTKELLKKAYSVLPNDFSLREVRLSIYQALQKIELFESKSAKKQEEQRKQQEQAELKRRTEMGIALPWQTQDVKQAISLIDKMIEEEKSKINVYKQKQSASQEDNGQDTQTFYG